MEKKRLKIVLALGSRHTIPPVSNSSGVAWILYHIAKRLSNDKFDVHVISKWHRELPNEIDPIYHHVNIDTPYARFRQRFWALVPYRYKKKLFTFSQADRIVYYKGIRKLVSQIKPDIVMSAVHAELFYWLQQAYPKAKHCYWYHSSHIFGMNKRLTDFLFKHAKGVLVLNDLTVNTINETLPGLNIPIHKIYNALDLSGYSDIDQNGVRQEQRKIYHYDNDDIVVGYAGRFAKEKNIMLLLKCLYKLNEQGVPIKLLMAGDIKNEKMPDWDYYNECIEYANKHLSGLIQFTGWISNKELHKFYCAIDLGVLLSQEREGSPMFFLEACSFGKPMIATAVGSNPEHVIDGENGYLIEVDKIEEQLPDKILKIIADKENYKAMSKRCVQYIIDHHSYEDKVVEFEDFIQKVAKIE